MKHVHSGELQPGLYRGHHTGSECTARCDSYCAGMLLLRLQESCVIHNMNSPVDYRRLAHHTRGIYFLTTDRTALLHAAFLEAGQDGTAVGMVGNPGPRSVQVAMGRQLTVPQALGERCSEEVTKFLSTRVLERGRAKGHVGDLTAAAAWGGVAG